MATVQSNNLEPEPSQTPMLHGDDKLITPTWTRWFINLRAKINVINASIVSLAGGATAGFLSSNGTGNIVPRTLTAGPNITITNPTGAAGNPVISASGGGGNPIAITSVNIASYATILANAPSASSYVGWIDQKYAGNNTVVIDINANVAYPIGTMLYVRQAGAGTTTILGINGVSFTGSTIAGSGQGSIGQAIQITNNAWAIFGNLAYSSNSDPYYANVKSLLHFDGTNGSTVFTDQKGNAWSQVGTTTSISTSQFKFGTASLYVGNTNGVGTNNGITTPNNSNYNFGTADFTIEWWQYLIDIGGYQTIYSYGYTTSGALLLQTGSGDGKYIVYVGGSAIITEASAATVGVWEFHSLVKDSGVLRKYRGGVQTASAASGTSISNSAILEIGGHTGTYALDGYIDDFRITNGVCRYPGGTTYTPPTAPFLNY